MIRALAERLRPRERSEAEAGFTVIEVMVAMMVFAIISVGVAYGVVNALQLTQNSRGRTTAVALATQDIDGLRQLAAATSDGIFNVQQQLGATQKLGGVTYTIDRVVNWVQSDGATGGCGGLTSTGTLAYKSVVETISWAGPHGGAKQSVTQTSAIAPSSAVSDPGDGTILISVTTGSGAPNPGVAITVTPIDGGAAALTTAPKATDSQGCSYALNVQPGNYKVSMTETGGIDTNQAQPSVTSPLSVKAGASSPVVITYDSAMNYTAKYASNAPAGTTAMIPTDMSTSVSSSPGGIDVVAPWTQSSTANITSASSVALPLFPFSSYDGAYAGTYANSDAGGSTTCLSPNPNQWTTPSASGVVGSSQPLTPSPGGGPTTLNIPMGIATLTGLGSTQRWITAVSSATPGAGDPGCNAGMTLRFAKASAGNATIALPYGTWTLYVGNSYGATTTNFIATSANNLSIVKQGTVNQSTFIIITWNNTVTFDPRIPS